MADKTLTVNGQPFTINRDRKADVSQLTVNGQAFHIDRTAPVIESDPVGNSRPLLDKLVGGAACACSLRDLNSKQGDTNVVKVRRSETNDEKIFKAKDVDKIEDWVTGKQEDTLPANIKSVTSFTLSGMTTYTDANGLYTLNSDGEYINGGSKFYKNTTTWTWTRNSSSQVVASRTAADYPWLTDWSDVVYGVGTNDLPNASFELHYTETNDAAFSLRKVNKDYTGKAMRVRRSSDDTEVDVAFDGEGKVSNQSIITNVVEEGGELRDTTFTTLGEFLKEEHEITSSNVLSNKANASVQGTTNEATNKLIDFTVNTLQKSDGTSTTNLWLLKTENHNKPSIGKVRISLDCTHFDFENGGDLYVQPYHDHDGNGSLSYANAIFISGTGHYSTIINLTTKQTSSAFRIFRGSVAVGDRVRIENLKIESLTSGASVHTWYNQSGAVNASEDTEANQPWVAEFGNVVDGVHFDGNRFLNIPANIMDTSDASLSMVVSRINTNAETHFLSNRNNTGGQGGYSISNKTSGDQGKLFFAFIGSGNQTTTNVVIENNSSKKQLFTFTKDKNDREFFGNGLQLADNAQSHTYVSPSSNLNTSIGKEGNNSGSASTKKLTIHEMIVYNHDKMTEQFNIHNNMNNYWGVYNDENEVSDTWSSPSTAVQNLSKDGFTVTNPTGSYAYIPFAFSLPANTPSHVRVSFMADDPDNALNQISVRRSENGVSGSVSAITDGFNSIDVSNNAGGTAVGLQIDLNSGTKTATLSDFKVSLISRDGFVTTWYDQSGHDRHASQDTEAYQPKLVSNGSICKTNNGYDAILFDGSDDFLSTNTYEPADEPNGLTDCNFVCVTGRPPTVTAKAVVSCGSVEGSNTIGGFYFSNNETYNQPTKQDIKFSLSEHDASPHIAHLIISATPLQDTNLLSFNRKGSDTTFESYRMDGTTLTGTSLVPKTGQSAAQGAALKIGAAMYHGTARRHYPGQILEVVFYDSNNRNNAVAINHNVKNQYKI